MNKRLITRLILMYFIVSLLLVIAHAILPHVPHWVRDSSQHSIEDIPPTLYEYTQIFLSTVFISSLYGLLSVLILWEITRGKNSGKLYFIVACVINIAAIGLLFFSSGVSRIDCGDNCVASLPSDLSVKIIGTLIALPFIVLPLSILIKLGSTTPPASKP